MSSPKVVIAFSDTAKALGLRWLLDRYFDIEAEIAGEQPPSAWPTAFFFTDPEIFCLHSDFFNPRRKRVVITGRGEGMLDTSSAESTLIDAIGTLLPSPDYNPEPSETLTPRETDVLRLAAGGLINKEIADRLGISLHTVLSHRKSIASKLGIKTPSGLSLYAMLHGYI